MPSPGRVRWAKFRVSVVSLVALLIFLTLAYLLTGGTLLEKKARLYLYIPDASGLAPGSPVRVDGIDVGTVESANLSGSMDPARVVKLVLSGEKDRLDSITLDSYAQITSDSLIGDKYVGITSQKSPAHGAEGAELPYKEQADLMKSLDLTQFETQLREMDTMLSDIEQGRTAVGQFVLGDQIYRNLLKRIAEIEKALRGAAATTGAVGEALYSDQRYRQASDWFLKLDQGLAKLQSGQGQGSNLLSDASQYDQAQKAVAGMRKTIAD